MGHENNAKNDLDLVTVGHGRLPNGQLTIVRVYAAPDGNTGHVFYTEFDSLRAAQEQMEKWVRITPTVTSRQKDQNIGGQLVSDRVLGLAEIPKSDKKEFVILRRDGLVCYLIDSPSLQVAMQVESLIEHK